ncbi:unnamed protein product [Paramecium sonneborni]|uniref:Uncharacterized protein n=1 Tax=Paramecium sonneborni TaxID=65129 RepID=A0A8S1KDK5_9CILI|nr:unnamed protein product [Paramecium sonneborni]
MCVEPKCPCIYPPLSHKSLKQISFRERSPIDRNLIRNKLTNIPKPLLSKIKYQLRPSLQIQYQLFAIFNLLGEQSDFWFRIQRLLNNYEQIVDQLTSLNVNQLSKKQIEKCQYWLDEFDKINKDNQVTVFADVAKGILSKIVKVEQKKNSIQMEQLNNACKKKQNDENEVDEVAILQVTQESQSEQQKILKQKNQSLELKTTETRQYVLDSPIRSTKNYQLENRQNNSSLYNLRRFLENSNQNSKSQTNLSFCKSQDKSFKDFNKKNNYQKKSNLSNISGGLFNDITSLKKELEMIQRDISRLKFKNKKYEFLQNRQNLRNQVLQNHELNRQELLNIRAQTQNDESFIEVQKKEQLKIERSHSAFKKELIGSKSPQNQKYLQYLEKYSQKYIPKLDRISQQEQEIRSFLSQIKLAEKKKIEEKQSKKVL